MRRTDDKTIPSIEDQAPLYKQVRRDILDCLASGEWTAGDRLPNELELAARWGVAISTIRAAIGQLVAAGVLTRRQGRGTFVMAHDALNRSLRFSNIYDSTGSKLRTEREILSMRRVRAERVVRQALQLEDDDAQVWQVQGLLRAGAEIVATIELLLPAIPFAALKKSDLQQPAQNLYAVYQRCCGVTVLRMEERIFARSAGDDLARTLRVAPGAPVLCVERTAFTFNDQPIEIRRRHFEASRHHYLFVQEHVG